MTYRPSRPSSPRHPRNDRPLRSPTLVDAQAPAIGRARAELAAGRKASHWMWFVFPQIAGLGISPIARRYAIGGAEEAVAYLVHPVLGPRLRDLTAVVNDIEDATARQIFGSPDDLKFLSCTLFAEVARGEPVFAAALDRYFAGIRDDATLARLGGLKTFPL